jgi:tetratricopeptide (TPR) repeat protein
VERQRDKARAHVQFGQLLYKSGRLSKALGHFEQAVQLDSRSARAHYELAETLQQIREPARAAAHYERVLELKPACVEAATNLAVAYLGADRAEDSVAMSRRAIQLQSERARAAAGSGSGGGSSSGGGGSSSAGSASAASAVNSEAHYNLNSALRACGRAAEAHAHTWQAIAAHGGSALNRLALDVPPGTTGSGVGSTASFVAGLLGRRSSAPALPTNKLTVVCVKWGNKYGPAYVNKLHAAVTQHCTLPFEFVCLTDNKDGIAPGVTVQPLEPINGWNGWWFKVSGAPRPAPCARCPAPSVG